MARIADQSDPSQRSTSLPISTHGRRLLTQICFPGVIEDGLSSVHTLTTISSGRSSFRFVIEVPQLLQKLRKTPALDSYSAGVSPV
jgi:hypothetical protein